MSVRDSIQFGCNYYSKEFSLIRIIMIFLSVIWYCYHNTSESRRSSEVFHHHVLSVTHLAIKRSKEDVFGKVVSEGGGRESERKIKVATLFSSRGKSRKDHTLHSLFTGCSFKRKIVALNLGILSWTFESRYKQSIFEFRTS